MGQQYFTSRLLSKIEPYYIDGIGKVSFYSEVNTNIQKNDKVFITNGYFDSEYYINKGKYVKNADGYRVLYVDRCRIVIDLDWTLLNKSTSIYYGVTQSYNIDSFDNYLKVYNIRSQREFDYINTLFVDSESSGRISKFERDISNSIIYSKDIFVGKTNDLGENSGLGAEHSFWQRVGTTWNIVTSDFLYSTFTCSNPNYNGKMIILGEDIEYGGKIFKERNIYKNIDPTTINSWVIDTESKSPIISKLYFKKGVFQGIHNDGIYGSYDHQQDWYATQSATWNGGLLVNSTWHSGSMNSKSTGNSASYYATLQNDIVIQTTDFSNNKGNGYNYVMDSNIQGGTVENGNFINCNIQDKTSLIDVIGAYYFENSIDYPLKLKGGIYQYCDISNVSISNSTTLDSIIDNTYLYNSKTLNSQLTKSHSNSGEFSINNGIAVNSAAISYYVPNYIGDITTNYTDVRGTLKLYISDSDYERLDTFDSFYISKINKDYIINSLSSDERIYLPLETRYILDKFWNSDFDGKYCIASLKSKYENTYITNVTSNNIFDISSPTFSNYQFPVIPKASVDIDLGNYLVVISNLINNNNVDNLFRNTFISNADFRDGVADYIKWTSGSNVNYPSNIINKKSANTKLDISKIDVGKLKITLPLQPTVNNNELAQGSYIWLDSIQHTNNSGTVDITGAYKVIGITNSFTSREITILGLTGVNTLDTYDKVNSYTNYSSSTYSVSVDLPKYVSISGLLIDNSEIKSGLFVRTLFRNSTFTNDEFNNEDLKLSNSNIDRLRFVNELLKSNNNIIKSGLVHKSHILDVTWKNGISNNSIWSGETFENGIFNSGYWIDGTFNNGYFQNSRDIILSIPDYSYKSYYKNWNDGTFNNGVFNKSVWMDGTFNNGKIYDSDWYGGVFNNGIIGDRNVPAINTNIGSSIGIGATQTFIYGGIVENAQVGGQSSVYWYDGKFNDGTFTSDNYIDSNESIWYGGEFNGGRFEKLARWKDGTFNNGKFISYYGWQLTSTYSTDFGWEFGKFNGGEFGNGSYATNSMWFDGEFNGGLFQGRVWNNGVFMNGTFNGGGTYSAVSYESEYVESFTHSYYGLWLNGWVTNIKHNALPDNLIDDNNIRNTQVEPTKIVNMSNALWVDGHFDHPLGKIYNSAWLSGVFMKGTFDSSVFNPYAANHWNSQLTTSAGVTEVRALSIVEITGTANNQDNIGIIIDNIVIGRFISSGSSTINDVALGLVNSLNNNTNGYTIDYSAAGSTFGIYARVGLGSFGNNLSISATYSTDIITSDSPATTTIVISTISSFTDDDIILISVDGNFGGQLCSFTYSSSTFTSDLINAINTDNTVGYTASLSGSDVLVEAPQNLFGDTINGSFLYVTDDTTGDYYTFSFSGGVTLATSLGISNTISTFSGGVDGVSNFNGKSFNFSTLDCIWKGGTLDNSLFYISDWIDGYFLSGTMSGAKWSNGIWYSGNANNIYWENGVWKNGVWNGSPFDYKNINGVSHDMLVGKEKDILLRVANLHQDGKIHLINAFTGSYSDQIFHSFTSSTVVGLSPSWTITNSNKSAYLSNTLTNISMSISRGSNYSWIWYYYAIAFNLSSPNPSIGDKITLSINCANGIVASVSVIASNTSKTTFLQSLNFKINQGFTQRVVEARYPNGVTLLLKWNEIFSNVISFSMYVPSYPPLIPAEGVILTVFRTCVPYITVTPAQRTTYSESPNLQVIANIDSSLTQSVFDSNQSYKIELDVSSYNGRTDFSLTIGDTLIDKSISNNREVLKYTYNTPSNQLNDNFYIKRKNYLGVTDNPIFTVHSLNIYKFDSSYIDTYNNKLYQFGTYSYATYSVPFEYGPTGSTVSLPIEILPTIISEDGEVISINFGNGMFKSGIWENGYWNNGWRDWSDQDKSILFELVENSIEVSPNLWNITLSTYTDINPTGSSPLISAGDKVSIGNLIAIDINDDRKLIKGYYYVTTVASNPDGSGKSTITVQTTVNFPTRTILKDSDNHMIYVTKNIWLSGIFHNGYFKGVWNNGLFQGYPYITKMEDSYWIDGIFDGGRFISTQSAYQNNQTVATYSTGLIQNFTFIDNNVGGPNGFKYNSWLDINYFTSSMTNLLRDNVRYDYVYNMPLSDGNLRGYPTNDVLSSTSIFRNSFDDYYKYYRLGVKYKVYNDFIGDSSYFNYPISSTDMIPGVDEFVENGWTLSTTDLTFDSNLYNSNPDDTNKLVVKYTKNTTARNGIKAVQSKSQYYYSPNLRIGLSNDFSQVSTNYIYKENGVQVLNKRMSNQVYQSGWSNSLFNFLLYGGSSGNWKYHTDNDLSDDHVQYRLSLRVWPSGGYDINSSNNSLYDQTIVQNRKVYMLDCFNVSETSSNGGYLNQGNAFTFSYTPITATGSQGTYSFYAYKTYSDQNVIVNAYIPFYFTLHEESTSSGWFNSHPRPGWSIFKFFGVVEKCGATYSETDDSSWVKVCSTTMDYYGTTGESNYSGLVEIDKDKCAVLVDLKRDRPFLGKLAVNNKKVSLKAGDKLRFRLYFSTIKKMFASSSNGGWFGSSYAPGYFELNIGTHSLSENTNGYFEVYDESTFESNVLENEKTKDIEKFRYSKVEFELYDYSPSTHPYQGAFGSNFSRDLLPSIYLLNDRYEYSGNLKYSEPLPPSNSIIVNHALTIPTVKEEYFYNRRSLNILFKSTEDFTAMFSKVSFYEVDMVPFFKYTTEQYVDDSIKKPLMGTSSVEVTGSFFIDSNRFKIDPRSM